MQLDVRNYLKKVRETQDLKVLESELNELIEESRKYRDEKYDKSPILAWFANRKIQEKQKALAE